MSLRADRVCHWLAAMVIVLLAWPVLVALYGCPHPQTYAIAFLIAMLIAVEKELWDKWKGGYFDAGDVIASLFGALAGLSALWIYWRVFV